MARSAPLNNPIAKEEYLALCRHAPELAHNTLNQGTGGPNSISFQKHGSTARGYPLRELLNLSSASQLDETSAAEISSFMGSGVTEVRLVIWGPDRPKGKWGHHIRRVPSGSLKSKAALGKLVAVEYMNFCKESQHRREAPDTYPDLQFDTLSLLAVKRVTGNVYQAELAGGPSSRGGF